MMMTVLMIMHLVPLAQLDDDVEVVRCDNDAEVHEDACGVMRVTVSGLELLPGLGSGGKSGSL